MKSISPYLSLAGKTREALTRYSEIFGGRPTFMVNGEAPEAARSNEHEPSAIFHGEIRGPGFSMMATDLGPPKPATLAVVCQSPDQVRRYFDFMSEGGEVVSPVDLMFWGDLFGMVRDVYGVTWMFSCKADAAES